MGEREQPGESHNCGADFVETIFEGKENYIFKQKKSRKECRLKVRNDG